MRQRSWLVWVLGGVVTACALPDMNTELGERPAGAAGSSGEAGVSLEAGSDGLSGRSGSGPEAGTSGTEAVSGNAGQTTDAGSASTEGGASNSAGEAGQLASSGTGNAGTSGTAGLSNVGGEAGVSGCAPDDERSCAEDGKKGSCAAGIEICTADRSWGPCSITAADADTCEPGNDDNCNGRPNEGCTCTDDEAQNCGPANENGVCQFGTSSCSNGVWGECIDPVYPGRRICASSEDNDCDGNPDDQIDDVCKCPVGNEQPCDEHAGLDGKGICHAGHQSCLAGPDASTSDWNECVDAEGPGEEGCTPNGIDEDCTGTPDDAVGRLSRCECEPGTTEPCQTHPQDGTGICHAGHRDCEGSLDDMTSNWGTTCVDSVGPAATELCNDDGKDENCNGQVNEGCACLNGTQRCYNDNLQTCTDGAYVTTEACPNVCYDLACTECAPPQKRCDGNLAQTCQSDGTYLTTDTCLGPDEICRGGACEANDPYIWGTGEALGNDASLDINYIYYFRLPAVTNTAFIQQFGFVGATQTGTSYVRFALYTDDGGVPGTRLVQTTTDTKLVVGANEEAPAMAGVQVQAGQTYWLALQTYNDTTSYINTTWQDNPGSLVIRESFGCCTIFPVTYSGNGSIQGDGIYPVYAVVRDVTP